MGLREDIDDIKKKALELTGYGLKNLILTADTATDVYSVEDGLQAGDETLRLCIRGDTKSIQKFLEVYNGQLGDREPPRCRLEIGDPDPADARPGDDTETWGNADV